MGARSGARGIRGDAQQLTRSPIGASSESTSFPLAALTPTSQLRNVATRSYIPLMTSVGIRELKNNLSRYIRRLRRGEVIAVTDRGRVVAELQSPESAAGQPMSRTARYAELVAAGVIRPAVETGDPLADWPTTRTVALPRGTVAALIDEDRGA